MCACFAAEDGGRGRPWQATHRPYRPDFQDMASFKTTSWEQRPRLFKATPERVAFFKGLLSLPHYLELARRREATGRGAFRCAKDVNAARYRQGKRETLTVEVRAGGVVVRAGR